ncbi:MAG: glycosyltransferase [Gammaproteobacteria bacterium]
MHVLLTNNTLAGRAGSELYVRDLALALLRLGHTPLAYSTNLGEVARELVSATVPVVDDLHDIGAVPDIIHGHHHLDTMTALLHFDRTPAIYFCHGWVPWEEAPPPRSPRIFRYIAVDDTCRDRLVFQHGIPEERVQVLLNFVDLERFQPRTPLPERPAKALVFSNYFNGSNDTGVIREACRELGITLDVSGIGSGNTCAAPETVLGGYDLVFAKGRAALEALAVGTAVIVCDAVGLGGMVTADNLAELRRLNFGIRTLRKPITVENIAREILRYARLDAAHASTRIRAEAGLDDTVDRLISMYREVIAEAGAQIEIDRRAEAWATSRYLRWLSPVLKDRYAADAMARQAEARAAQAVQERGILEAARVQITRERHEIEARLAAQAEQNAADRNILEARLAAQAEQIEALTRHAADRDRLEARCRQAAQKQSELESLSRQVARERDDRQRQLDRISTSRAWHWVLRYGRFREHWMVRPLRSMKVLMARLGRIVGIPSAE